ncbi:dynamin family protein [Luteibacter sp. dw_328]|uniref:dynamin family protein n=1 Tax=Luteibacter sp. dw_328 TaxID=2719796 RepID=UPI001BD6571B|nr:dynamin family protein [Luteibacter sp. dw_328]
MMSVALVEKVRRLHAWSDTYQDVIGRDFSVQASKHGVDTHDRLAATIAGAEDAGRLLTIGIVGRVKAGKSSLLNALLFDGKPVLPKAATPMTAALTTLAFGETFRAEVQYFSSADLERISGDGKRFQDRRKLIADGIIASTLSRARENAQPAPDMNRLRDLAERQSLRTATEEAPSMAASHDQWRRIEAARHGVDSERPGAIDGSSPEDLAARLMDFVGPEGRYMPFTKSVDIYMPIEWLKDIRIVDTPGMDDPVQSREERTRQLLKDCDVIFIVSPAGQFLNHRDIEAMSLITRREGVRHLAVVASQVDNQLFGSEKRATPEATLEGISSVLRGHMRGTLTRLTDSNPEFRGAFDELINAAEETLLWTSSACQGLATRFDETDSWDSTDRTVWRNLSEHFPEFFDEGNPERSKATLRLLSNIDRLKASIDEVRKRKAALMASKLDDLVTAKSIAVRDLKSALRQEVEKRSAELDATDVKALRGQRLKLENAATKAGHAIDGAFVAWKHSFLDAMTVELTKALVTIYDEAVERSADAKHVVKGERTGDGVGNWLADVLWDGGKVKTETLTVFRDQAVTALELFARQLNDRIITTSERNETRARTDIETALVRAAEHQLIRAYEISGGADDDDNELASETIISWVSRAVTVAVNSLKVDLPAPVKVDRSWPSEQKLVGSAANSFIEDVRMTFLALRDDATTNIHDFVASMHASLPKTLAHVVFDDLLGRVDSLIGHIESLAISRERFALMKKELEAI